MIREAPQRRCARAEQKDKLVIATAAREDIQQLPQKVSMSLEGVSGFVMLEV